MMTTVVRMVCDQCEKMEEFSAPGFGPAEVGHHWATWKFPVDRDAVRLRYVSPPPEPPAVVALCSPRCAEAWIASHVDIRLQEGYTLEFPDGQLAYVKGGAKPARWWDRLGAR